MFRSKKKEEKDRLEARSVELARTCKEQQDYINKLEEFVNSVIEIHTVKGQGSMNERYRKVDKLVDDWQSRN